MRRPVFLALLLAAVFGFQRPAVAQPATDPVVIYVHPARPPGLDLWPPAPYPVNCTAGGIDTARRAGGVVAGVLRSSGGRWEILYGAAWVPYVPAAHRFYADVYYRVGPCWVGGHGHGSDGEVGTSEELYFPTVHGRAPTLIETVDMKWYPVGSSPYGLYWLRSEWRRITGQPAPEPPPPPVNLCGNQRCDPGEQFNCRGDCCPDGTCQTGETCSQDCRPVPDPEPPPPVCPPCTVDETACQPFLDPLRVEIQACASQRSVLTGRVTELEAALGEARRRQLLIPPSVERTLGTLTEADLIGSGLRADIDDTARWIEAALRPLPPRQTETLAIMRTAVLWGAGRKGRAGELLTYVLARGVRPEAPQP